MEAPRAQLLNFSYRAQNPAGEDITGTIDAESMEAASAQLSSMQLRIEQLQLSSPTVRLRPLRGEDFQTFNLQFAHLTQAGLPIENSLRLIADDMRTGRLASTVRAIATDLESGRSLPEAFDRHQNQFPPLYGLLVGAGINTGNLSAVLLNLGRHLELITRLRSAIWRAVSYPLLMLISLLFVLVLLSTSVFPQFGHLYRNWGIQLPMISLVVINIAGFLHRYGIFLATAIIAIIVVGPIIWHLLGRTSLQQTILETIVFPIPLIGAALKRNLLARWCDALKLAVEAGTDLPSAIRLAGDTTNSPAMKNDGSNIIAALNSGQPIESAPRGKYIPPSVVAVIAMAAANNDLPRGLDTLSAMFQQQAEAKIGLIPAILTPVMVLLVASAVVITIIALFAPLFSLTFAMK